MEHAYELWQAVMNQGEQGPTICEIGKFESKHLPDIKPLCSPGLRKSRARTRAFAKRLDVSEREAP